MDEPYFVNRFMPDLLPEDALPVMVRAAGEDSSQEALMRQSGYPAYHAMLSVSGAGELKTEAGIYDVPAGHVFMLAPGQPHAYSPKSGRWHTCWVVFYGLESEGIVSRLDLAMGVPFLISDAGLFRGHYQRICAYAQENTIQGIYKASADCYALLAALSFERNRERGPASPYCGETRLAPVLEFIHTWYAQDIGLIQMAQCINVSQQHLCKLFLSALSMTPCEYLLQYRLKKVKELLMDRALPARRAGALCGFRDPSYFCAAFKKQTGYTPKEFRRIFLGDEPRA